MEKLFNGEKSNRQKVTAILNYETADYNAVGHSRLAAKNFTADTPVGEIIVWAVNKIGSTLNNRIEGILKLTLEDK
jgi:hypothetical protein